MFKEVNYKNFFWVLLLFGIFIYVLFPKYEFSEDMRFRGNKITGEVSYRDGCSWHTKRGGYAL